MLQQDLLGGWTIIKEWGYQGASGRVKRAHYPDRETAQCAMLEARDAHLKRGYRVVFTQGACARQNV